MVLEDSDQIVSYIDAVFNADNTEQTLQERAVVVAAEVAESLAYLHTKGLLLGGLATMGSFAKGRSGQRYCTDLQGAQIPPTVTRDNLTDDIGPLLRHIRSWNGWPGLDVTEMARVFREAYIAKAQRSDVSQGQRFWHLLDEQIREL